MPDHLLLTFMVTRDGEPGHPMDHIVTRIDLDDAGQPIAAAMARLDERVRREVSRQAALASGSSLSAEGGEGR